MSAGRCMEGPTPWDKGLNCPLLSEWDVLRIGLHNGGTQIARISSKFIYRNNVTIRPRPSNNEAKISRNLK